MLRLHPVPIQNSSPECVIAHSQEDDFINQRGRGSVDPKAGRLEIRLIDREC